MVALYPGGEKLTSMTAAALLSMWKVFPDWCEWEPTSTDPRKQTLEESLTRSALETKVWSKLFKEDQLPLLKFSHEVFEKWSSAESRKASESSDEATGIVKINFNKLNRQFRKSLPIRYRRSTITMKLLLESNKKFLESDVIKTAVSNTRVYEYVRWESADRGNLKFTEIYPNYSKALDAVRSWITVSTNQVLFSKLEAIENEMIIGIEKVIKSLNADDDQLRQIMLFCLTQAKEYASVSIESNNK